MLQMLITQIWNRSFREKNKMIFFARKNSSPFRSPYHVEINAKCMDEGDRDRYMRKRNGEEWSWTDVRIWGNWGNAEIVEV